MTTNRPPENPGALPPDRETEINALLDGELDDARTAALKAAAAEDSALAQAIVSAWQLQKSLDQLKLEKAPASLTRRLRRIPGEHSDGWRSGFTGWPRWAAAAGFASLVLVVAVVLNWPAPPAPGAPAPVQTASQAELEQVRQARRDLQVAFYYLDKAGLKVGKEIQGVLSDELSEPVKENLLKHVPYSEPPRKEKHA